VLKVVNSAIHPAAKLPTRRSGFHDKLLASHGAFASRRLRDTIAPTSKPNMLGIPVAELGMLVLRIPE
jgi:hypothetical protein